MRPRKPSQLAAIIADLGTEIKIADVRAKYPSCIGEVMQAGERISRGVYRVNADATPIEKQAVGAIAADVSKPTPVSTVSAAIKKITSDTVSLIPPKSPDYVPHGCYDVVKRVVGRRTFCPVYIVGLSGNGKTFGVEQACAAEKRELVLVNITNETAEEDLIGSYILQDGDMVWKDGPVILAMRRGAVLCLDELDQTTPRIMCLNTIAQGKPYYIKKTNEIVEPAPGFTLIGTANTKGTGDGADSFAGAQILNEAFLERFNITVEQTYPTESTERKILSRHTEDKELVERLVKFAKVTRSAFSDGVMQSCITTRRLVQICQNIEIFGGTSTKGAEKSGVKYAIARFDSETRDSFAELYDKLVKEDPTDTTAAATKEDEATW